MKESRLPPPVLEKAERALGDLEAANSQHTQSVEEATDPILGQEPATEEGPSGEKPEEEGQADTPSESSATLQPPELALKEDILEEFLKLMRKAGVVGEDKVIATECLAITSRVLDKPVSLVVKGASSSGKSYGLQKVCNAFPGKAFVKFSGLSEKAVLFSEKSFEHRTLIVFEAVALRERAEKQSGDQTAYFIRSLVSEGEAHYEMSVRGKDNNWTTKRFEKKGPTNVIVTTTAVALHNENETRMLSLSTNDSPDQTRNVLRRLANEASEEIDFTAWHGLQEWIFRQKNQVSIPYGRYLVEKIPPVSTRLRRDVDAVLSLIRAHAVLHQATRERDDKGRIIASPVDYEKVKNLVLHAISEGVGSSVSETIRETVAVVPEAEGLTAAEVGAKLDLDKSAAGRRLGVARAAGFVINEEDRKGRPGRWVKGADLPEDVEILPTLPPDWEAQLQLLDRIEASGDENGCTGAGDSEGIYPRSETPKQEPSSPDRPSEASEASEASVIPSFSTEGIEGIEGWNDPSENGARPKHVESGSTGSVVATINQPSDGPQTTSSAMEQTWWACPKCGRGYRGAIGKCPQGCLAKGVPTKRQGDLLVADRGPE